MDAVAIAKIVKGTETETDAEFELVSVIRRKPHQGQPASENELLRQSSLKELSS